MIIQNANNLIFYSTKDVSTILKCSKQTAQEIMRVYGFKLGNTFDTSANLYHSMLLHSAFQSLTSRQKAFYLCMKDQYYCCKNHPNGDRLQFYFNWALANKVYKIYTNKNTFYNDIKVLVEKGFIKIIENNKNLRQKNVYAFDTRWRQYDIYHGGKNEQN